MSREKISSAPINFIYNHWKCPELVGWLIKNRATLRFWWVRRRDAPVGSLFKINIHIGVFWGTKKVLWKIMTNKITLCVGKWVFYVKGIFVTIVFERIFSEISKTAILITNNMLKWNFKKTKQNKNEQKLTKVLKNKI